MTIHWCGTGLSAVPGLRRLLEDGHDLCVWERDVARAQAAVGDLTDWIEPFDLGTLREALSPDDIVVAMVPAEAIMPLAHACVAEGAHLVSSMYVTPELQALDGPAKAAGLRLVSEVGLDPGIDHLMAHALMADMRASGAARPGADFSFRSYCGGIPREPDAFRYKFSWSPLGVLRALSAPSRSIREFSTLEATRPWDAIRSYGAPLSAPETFEVYPNRDSLPYLAEYGFEAGWKIREFVRGTLRPVGWADAWSEIFAAIEQGADLEALSERLWREHAYRESEADRVVLCVSLEVRQEGATVWHKTHVLDAHGDARGSAMARLVSHTVAMAVDSIAARALPAGVSRAPRDPKLLRDWLAAADRQAQHMAVVGHVGRR